MKGFIWMEHGRKGVGIRMKFHQHNTAIHMLAGLSLVGCIAVLPSTALGTLVVTQHLDNSYIVFEAEIGDPVNHNATNYWLTISDTNANGGLAIEGFRTSGPGTHGQMVYTFFLTNAGTYKLYHRSRIIDEDGNGSTANNDSFNVGTNFNLVPNITFETPGGSANYAWRLDSGRSNYTATASGVFTFSISPRETGATVDTIVFSTDFALTGTQLDAIVARGNIPEPSVLGLLTLAAVALLCRRAKCTTA